MKQIDVNISIGHTYDKENIHYSRKQVLQLLHESGFPRTIISALGTEDDNHPVEDSSIINIIWNEPPRKVEDLYECLSKFLGKVATEMHQRWVMLKGLGFIGNSPYRIYMELNPFERFIKERRSLQHDDFFNWPLFSRGTSTDLHALVASEIERLRQADMPRRTMLKVGLATAAGAASYATVSSFTQLEIFIKSLLSQRQVETDNALLTQLFGAPHTFDKMAIVPARNHPFVLPDKGAAGYEIEVSCAGAYMRRLYGTVYQEETVNGLVQIYPGDSIAAFGSQVSNLVVRDVLGNPFSSNVLRRVPIPPASTNPGGSFSLRWNLCSNPKAPCRVRRQYGRDWKYKPHVFWDFEDGKPIQPENDEKADLLLVTVLPRNPETQARIVIFAGLHGPGTRATCLIFDNPPVRDLRGWRADLDTLKTLGTNTSYQALFDVEVKDGMPINLHLRAAKPLRWSSDPSPQLVSIKGLW